MRCGASSLRPYTAPVIARWTVVAAMLLTQIGCAAIDVRPTGTVILYGRAAPAADQWFGLVPLSDPPETVGFGSDGVACLAGPAGQDVVWFKGQPGNGGGPRQVLGRVPGEGGPLVIWVEVAPDGSLRSGQGVPAWWQGDPQTCPDG